MLYNEFEDYTFKLPQLLPGANDLIIYRQINMAYLLGILEAQEGSCCFISI